MYFKYSRKKGDDYIRFLLDDYFSPKSILEKVEVKTNRLAVIEELNYDEIEIDEDDIENDELIQFVSKLKIEQINDYVLSLKAAAKHWYNSFNPISNPDYNPKERIAVDRLNRTGIGYFRPLVMALYANESIEETSRLKLLDAIERFIFIVFRLSRAQSNYRNSSYFNATKDLYFGDKSVEDILLMLENDLKWNYDKDGNYKYTFLEIIFTENSSLVV